MELIRVALLKILSAVSNLIVCAATGDCDEVADLVERHRPHLVIAEPFQENRDGIMWIKDLAARFPQTKKSWSHPRRLRPPTRNARFVLVRQAIG